VSGEPVDDVSEMGAPGVAGVEYEGNNVPMEYDDTAATEDDSGEGRSELWKSFTFCNENKLSAWILISIIHQNCRDGVWKRCGS
jgi:hypothetical protein